MNDALKGRVCCSTNGVPASYATRYVLAFSSPSMAKWGINTAVELVFGVHPTLLSEPSAATFFSAQKRKMLHGLATQATKLVQSAFRELKEALAQN
jgi:hypothetical protein